MSIGNLQTEADLRTFLLRELDGSAMATLVRQLQASTLRDRGVNTVTFTAAATSANKTVAHALGIVPVVVHAIDQTAGSGIYYRTNNYTPTTFDVLGFSPFGALSASTAFGWTAVG